VWSLHRLGQGRVEGRDLHGQLQLETKDPTHEPPPVSQRGTCAANGHIKLKRINHGPTETLIPARAREVDIKASTVTGSNGAPLRAPSLFLRWILGDVPFNNDNGPGPPRRSTAGIRNQNQTRSRSRTSSRARCAFPTRGARIDPDPARAGGPPLRRGAGAHQGGSRTRAAAPAQGGAPNPLAAPARRRGRSKAAGRRRFYLARADYQPLPRSRAIHARFFPRRARGAGQATEGLFRSRRTIRRSRPFFPR